MNLNETAPDFELSDLNGIRHRLTDYRGQIVVLNFWSCECPHVERTDSELLALCNQAGEDMALLSVASNRSEPKAALDRVARARGLPVLLLDHDHHVADLYEALTTPHVFLIDRNGVLRYRGAVDDADFRQKVPQRFYLREALRQLLNGKSPEIVDTPAYGCAIIREALE
jgi:peroxiredoxin